MHLPAYTRLYQLIKTSTHINRETKLSVRSSKFEILEWPAKRPDLNPIENLWVDLVRHVYHNGRHFPLIEKRNQVLKMNTSKPILNTRTVPKPLLVFEKRIFESIKNNV